MTLIEILLEVQDRYQYVRGTDEASIRTWLQEDLRLSLILTDAIMATVKDGKLVSSTGKRFKIIGQR